MLMVNSIFGRFSCLQQKTEKKIKTETRCIDFYKTGHEIYDDISLEYLGFCKLFIGEELGLYVFERIK